jgi:hypothetical protein
MTRWTLVVTTSRRKLSCLPVKWAGLAIPDPTVSAEPNHLALNSSTLFLTKEEPRHLVLTSPTVLYLVLYAIFVSRIGMYIFERGGLAWNPHKQFSRMVQ